MALYRLKEPQKKTCLQLWQVTPLVGACAGGVPPEVMLKLIELRADVTGQDSEFCGTWALEFGICLKSP